MQMCDDHWAALKKAIDDRGLSSLIAEDGRAAIDNISSELDHGSTIDNFDPLMGAHNAITSNLMRHFGLAVMMGDCQLCYANDKHNAECHIEVCKDNKAFYDSWIQNAADNALTAWRRLGAENAT